MITREQYNNALDIVEEYHNQLSLVHVDRCMGKTMTHEWDRLSECSTRLYNVLTGAYGCGNQNEIKMEFIEDITRKDFKRQKLAGLKSWLEFIELRGF